MQRHEDPIGMPYKGWNFEKTLLARSPSGPRTGEPVDVRIPLDARSSSHLDRDVRVVLKKDWHLVDREIPSQVYRIERHGGVATCRVAFTMDVPAGDDQRVGIYYDNPEAPAPRYESRLEMTGSPLGGSVKTPFYTAGLDERSGQVRTLTGRFDVPHIDPLYILLLERVQEHAAVLLAVPNGDGQWRSEYASPAMWEQPEVIDDIRGPVFIQIARRGRLAWPGCPQPQRCPDCRITYRFLARQPYLLVHTRVSFDEDTDVFGVRVGTLSAGRERFTHYTFRPVSPPGLPDTDIEEMGHILIDPAHTAGLPCGPVFSGLLPYDLAWHGFIRTRKGVDAGLAAIQLQHEAGAPDGPFPFYRAASYLFREPDGYSLARAPVYVKEHRPENIVRIPAGTVIENLDAIVCDRFDAGWGDRTDALGRRLNEPVRVALHPRFMLGDVPPEAYEPLPCGRRADAYRRYGVR